MSNFNFKPARGHRAEKKGSLVEPVREIQWLLKKNKCIEEKAHLEGKMLAKSLEILNQVDGQLTNSSFGENKNSKKEYLLGFLHQLAGLLFQSAQLLDAVVDQVGSVTLPGKAWAGCQACEECPHIRKL